jgi:hypothetical protein
MHRRDPPARGTVVARPLGGGRSDHRRSRRPAPCPGAAQRAAAVHDRDRRRGHPLHPRPVAARGGAAPRHDPRLARLGDRAARPVGPLTDPTAHGGSAEDAFHLVLPSLPGYGFSGEPIELGWESGRIARAWAELLDRLGDTRHVAQGGDAGAAVTDAMGRQAPEGLPASRTSTRSSAAATSPPGRSRCSSRTRCGRRSGHCADRHPERGRRHRRRLPRPKEPL